MTVEDADAGLQENPIRGAKLFRSGFGSDEPSRSRATTGVAEANAEATWRFTSRPYFSFTGVQYSQRIPALMVRPGFTRQSSFTYASLTEPRRYLSAFPK